jgi:hypothetical protein
VNLKVLAVEMASNVVWTIISVSVRSRRIRVHSR